MKQFRNYLFMLICLFLAGKVFPQPVKSLQVEPNGSPGIVSELEVYQNGMPYLLKIQKYFDEKKLDSCIFFAEVFMKSPVFQAEFTASDRIRFLKWLASVYDKNGEPQRGYTTLLKVSLFNDSLIRSQTDSLDTELLVKYETLQKEKELSALDAAAKIKDGEIKASRNWSYAYFSCIVLLIFLYLFVWYYSSNKKKKQRLIFEKGQVGYLLNGQEAERQRIASDLNDRLGVMLATVKLYFNAFRESSEKIKQRGNDHYEKANKLLDEACEEVRKIAFDLASGVLAKFGLLPALYDLKETVTKSGKVSLRVFCFGLKQRLPAEIEVNLFRIVQELLNNSVRHGLAKNITLQLNETSGNLNLTFEDDGMGFDSNDARAKSGIGLRNIAERVKILHGNFFIDSQIGRGTTVIVDVPLV